MMKLFFLGGMFMLATTITLAQNFDLPENVVLQVADDYAKYEQNIVSAAKWLKATPMYEQAQKRQQVSAFVFKWINGSPTVMVEINENIIKMDKKNPGMLILYMAGCARYVLENGMSKDVAAKQKAALMDMVDVYKNGPGIVKDKRMDALAKAADEGTLDEWMSKNLKINK